MSNDSATHKNILAIQQHSNRTREIAREVEAIVNDYEKENKSLKNKIALMEQQIKSIQVKLFSGGATS